jgi:hypothetical protein
LLAVCLTPVIRGIDLRKRQCEIVCSLGGKLTSSGTLTAVVVAHTKVDIFGWDGGHIGTLCDRVMTTGSVYILLPTKPEDALELLYMTEWQRQLLMGGHQWRPCPKKS